MEDKALAKELDQWIASLQECKQLEESHVKILCDKVRDHKKLSGMSLGFLEMYMYSICWLHCMWLQIALLDNMYMYSTYRKSGNFRCKNIFVVDGGYEN